MNDLFRSELRRFRGVALLLAGLHLLGLLFVQRMHNLLQQTWFEALPLFALYLLLGLALALYQVGSYRKPSQWMWLMHRPLAPSRIFAALSVSALCLLALVILLPQWLLLFGAEAFTARVVDLRHVLAAVHSLAYAMMAWLIGCHAVLSRHRAAIAVLATPLLLAMHLVSVWWLLVPVSLMLAWLAVVALHSVRANRNEPLKRPLPLLLTALPLQLGVFVLLFKLGQAGFVTTGILLGTDPLNTEYPPQGGLIELSRLPPHEALGLGLAGSADPRADAWREQLPLLEVEAFGPYLQRYPQRHQLLNLPLPAAFIDEERSIVWTFSHDSMRFHGRDPRTGAARGEWGLAGAGDAQPFAEVPIAAPEGHLMTRDALFAIDDEAQRLQPLLRLPAGEWFTEIPQHAFGRLLVMTNQRLMAYRPDRAATQAHAPPVLDWQLELPRGIGRLDSVLLTQLMEGWLVSFVHGDGMRQIGFSQFAQVADPLQCTVFIDETGVATPLHERAVSRDYPLASQLAWWISPALHALSEWPDRALDKGLTTPLEVELWPNDRGIQLIALLLLAASALGAWLWLRGEPVPPGRRRFWLACCGLIGLPALVSLICLEPRRGAPSRP
ncbi:hypothetical protein [Pseudomarimonas salicorniae]|uniref:ABC transporter permease n=1 Tax=Pseudomarimonas salicorniae TaxID=2933270 RepID=A0ABT0GI06_9GAMM|nr:hypothetical protein [Lysobacter sp. CAU 1642]MCK7594173.1 hypothetical protein [Lysobacter sp. CAU 1642]